MEIKKTYEAAYKEYCGYFPELTTKYHWAATMIFDLVTYDDDLEELFVKKIIEVCRAILDGKTFDYISGHGENYRTYIIVCNLLNGWQWIDWGTSIRGAWFQDGQNSRHLMLDDGSYSVPFTADNMRALVEFIEEAEQTNDQI